MDFPVKFSYVSQGFQTIKKTARSVHPAQGRIYHCIYTESRGWNSRLALFFFNWEVEFLESKQVVCLLEKFKFTAPHDTKKRENTFTVGMSSGLLYLQTKQYEKTAKAEAMKITTVKMRPYLSIFLARIIVQMSQKTKNFPPNCESLLATHPFEIFCIHRKLQSLSYYRYLEYHKDSAL